VRRGGLLPCLTRAARVNDSRQNIPRTPRALPRAPRASVASSGIRACVIVLAACSLPPVTVAVEAGTPPPHTEDEGPQRRRGGRSGGPVVAPCGRCQDGGRLRVPAAAADAASSAPVVASPRDNLVDATVLKALAPMVNELWPLVGGCSTEN